VTEPFKRRRWFRFSLRMLLALLALAVIAWASGVRIFAFPGEPMSPTVLPGDHFVGMVGLWGLRAPKRLDMVIFDVPGKSKWAGQGIPWMKRLVGLPREIIRLSGDQLFVNGQKIDAPQLHVDNDLAHEDVEVTLGEGEYFVVGDNLDHSFDDSRAFGPIHRALIRGDAAFVIRKSH
jgi:signal peptidase I